MPCLLPLPPSLHQPRDKLCWVSTGGVGSAIYSKTKEDFGAVGLKHTRNSLGQVWGRRERALRAGLKPQPAPTEMPHRVRGTPQHVALRISSCRKIIVIIQNSP